MKTQNALGCLAILAIVLLAATGCNGATPAAATSTPTAAAISAVTPEPANGGNSNSSPSATPDPTATPMPTATSTPSPTPTPTASPSPTPTIRVRSVYIIQQTRTVGGEKIDGLVCSLSQPFNVNVATPAVSFVMAFVPGATGGGRWTYAYTLTSAGESHDARGSYTTAKPGDDGKIPLSMKGSDHVVFHGFDGNIPFRYDFNLVPALNTLCPNTP